MTLHSVVLQCRRSMVSTGALVMVRQGNDGTDYDDISASDLTITGETGGEEVVIDAAQDASLYEGDGSLANGSGSYLFTGATESQNDSLERRALIAFDIESAIPVGATIIDVSFELTMSKTVSGDQTVELRRVTESWGEGPSDPSGQEGGGAAAVDGDSTWVHRTFPSNMWATVGGSFAATASASESIGGTGPYTFGGTAEIALGPGETVRYDDLLLDVFGLSEGVGAAAVVSASHDIVVMTRTFNSGADGTFGQSLPGVAGHDLIPADTRALVLFLTEDGELRSNLGLVNGIDSSITVQWELFASDGSSLGTGSTNLPPWGNKQLNRVLANFAPIEAAYAHVWTTTSGGAFACYGSVLDELSSDPTTVLPR